MTDIEKIFYNIFWNNKSCQTLFLLSKEELLETFEYEIDSEKYGHSLPRILISNSSLDSNDTILETVKYRTDTQNIFLDTSIQQRLNHFVPIFENLFETKLRRPIENFIKKLEEKGGWEIVRILFLLSDDKKREKNIIKLLQDYNFIHKNISNFNQLEEEFKRIILPKKGGQIITEKNINTFFEGVKLVKDIYVNYYYKRLFSSNQILVNILNIEDNFESRIKLFHLLYENKIISSSDEDALVECTNCRPGTYKGAFKIDIDPKKLEKLKCPVCDQLLTYFVPYTLHENIFNIIKSKDGLLLNAYCQLLTEKKIPFLRNQNYLGNIEVDCEFYDAKSHYIVESKMYKINTPPNRLLIKLKKDLRDLVNECKRLQKLDKFTNKVIKPILLVNIIDNKMLFECENIFKENNLDSISQGAKILNFNMIQKN